MFCICSHLKCVLNSHWIFFFPEDILWFAIHMWMLVLCCIKIIFWMFCLFVSSLWQSGGVRVCPMGGGASGKGLGERKEMGVAGQRIHCSEFFLYISWDLLYYSFILTQFFCYMSLMKWPAFFDRRPTFSDRGTCFPLPLCCPFPSGNGWEVGGSLLGNLAI